MAEIVQFSTFVLPPLKVKLNPGVKTVLCKSRAGRRVVGLGATPRRRASTCMDHGMPRLSAQARWHAEVPQCR
eukprot:6189862-Prymnesium_polylepis.1